MYGIINVLLSVALQPVTKALVAALGPSIRQLQQFNLNVTDLTAIVAKVGELALGKTPTYSPVGLLTADEQKDIVEALHATMKALMTSYGVALTDAQVGKLLEAVAARLTEKFPAAV